MVSLFMFYTCVRACHSHARRERPSKCVRGAAIHAAASLLEERHILNHSDTADCARPRSAENHEASEPVLLLSHRWVSEVRTT